jgi:hypothetical protein
METITYVIMAVVATIGLMSAGYAILKARQSGNKDVPWDKIRPILTETFIRIKEVNDLKKVGYQAMEDYAVLLVREQILKATFLNDMEKSLISDDLIRSIIGPRLREIYEEQDKK